MSMLTRRGLLKSAGAMACSTAAHPLLTTATFASAPGDARLVVLILRGGMDGLDAVQPIGDRAFKKARPELRSENIALDGFYAMHSSFSGLKPLWDAEELAFVHAVSTPYRDKRSHFDGQDLLEAGTGMDVSPGAARDGWLNRLLQSVPNTSGQTAFAIGQENLKILSGPAEVANWSPATPFDLSPQAMLLLQQIYAGDPLFQSAASEALELSQVIEADRALMGDELDDEMMEMMANPVRRPEQALAAFAADRLNNETRIASFSINGWDTHRNQKNPLGQGIERLSDTILTLKQGLGANWANTTILAMTEFGRTVRENGTGGTDHGTGGAMLFAGGALNGGQIWGEWPGLAEADLYDRRDLMPTGDVRAFAGAALGGLFGLSVRDIEGTIFPGLDMAEAPRILL